MRDIIIKILTALAFLWALVVFVSALWRMLVYPFSLGLVEALEAAYK